jgi:RNA polymerase sigma-B factor
LSVEPAPRDALKAKFAVYAETRATDVRDELVEAHLGMATYLARRFSNRGEAVDDLVQVASLALVKAVDRFDPDRGFEFSTFATQTIVGELKRHFRDRAWSVRAPRRMQELYLRLNKIIDSLGQTLGHPPSIAELAAAAEVSEEAVLEALEAGQAYRSASLDAPAGEGESHSLASVMGADDPGMANAESRAVLEPLLQQLTPRDRLIVDLRFFKEMTQSEIASELGISQMHVSRLLAKSLAKLRTAGNDAS